MINDRWNGFFKSSVFLCVLFLSLPHASLQGLNTDYYSLVCDQDCSDEFNPDSQLGVFKDWRCWIGGTLMGAGLGAVAGVVIADDDNPKKGERGPRGPRGLSGAAINSSADCHHPLDFRCFLEVLDNSLIGLEATFFVAYPNGVVQQCSPILIQSPGRIEFSSIFISSALDGEYVAGLQIIGTPNSTGISSVMQVLVTDPKERETLVFVQAIPPVLTISPVRDQINISYINGVSL